MRLIRPIFAMTNDPRDKRLPAALSNQLSRALHGIRELELDLALELLEKFRRNQVRLIATTAPARRKQAYTMEHRLLSGRIALQFGT